MLLRQRIGIATLALTLLVSSPLLAARPKAPEFIPILNPEHCSETEWRVLLWRSAVQSTQCASSQALLKMLLPGCKTRQVVTYDGEAFVCTDLAALVPGKSKP
jgi:hypothetical protein